MAFWVVNCITHTTTMQPNTPVFCSVCGSNEHTFYTETNALMHKPNHERFEFHQCDHCHSVFLTNPVSEDRLEHYYTKYYLPYRGSAPWGRFRDFVDGSQRRLDKRRVRVVSRAANTSQTIDLLDVGCGNPTFLRAANETLNVRCTGMDFSDKGWANDADTDLNLIQSTFEAFDTPQRFDVITLWHYLEHDYNLPQTARKLYDLLKPGGKLIVEVPDYQSLTARIQKTHWQGWHTPRHVTLFSKTGFQTLFPSHKWTIRQRRRYGTLDAFTLWWLGVMEKKGANWTGSMEGEFWPLVARKILSFPVFAFERLVPMGVQLLVIEKTD